MATLKEISEKTGYSLSTVSKALNGYEDVSRIAKQRIIKIAEELNYYPNYKLKKVKKRDTKSIALIINGFSKNNEGSTLLYDLMAGIFNYASLHNIEMVVYTMDKQKQNHVSYYEFCRTRNIDGAILSGIALDDPYFQELEKSNLPIVMIDILLENKSERVGAVTVPNREAERRATDFLIRMGHREIAFLNGKKVAQVSNEREAGFLQAMREHNLEVANHRILYGDFFFERAFNEALRLLQTDHEITAFVCASDIMAFGVYEACQKLELQIPEDISVVGFDGLPISRYVSPKLTTVEQDMYAMGEKAAEMLREIIVTQKEGAVIFAECNLVIRDSVRKISETFSKI